MDSRPRRTLHEQTVISQMPSNRALGLYLAAALIGAGLAQLNLQITFAAVNHPVALGTANLEADPDVVRTWYRTLMDQGTYLQFIRTELVDLIWPILLAIAIICLVRFIAGLLRGIHPPIASGMFRWAPLFAIGPVFDLVENTFSLAMLTNPFAFPEWWAIAHVIASWIKISASVASPVVGLTLTVIAISTSRGGQKATDARRSRQSDRQDLPSR